VVIVTLPVVELVVPLMVVLVMVAVMLEIVSVEVDVLVTGPCALNDPVGIHGHRHWEP